MITSSEPDERGHWDKFGGRYVPETLVAHLEELTSEFTRARSDPDFAANSTRCFTITLAGQRRCSTPGG
jgi:tryptophan synthase beta chain